MDLNTAIEVLESNKEYIKGVDIFDGIRVKEAIDVVIKEVKEKDNDIIKGGTTVEPYILSNIKDALRLSANALDSRKRLTAMDRQIDYSERLINWVIDGKKNEVPKWIP